jgi:benzoate/toluate 1,2-dioxygenase beta subunit
MSEEAALLRRVEAFLYREAWLLDERRFEDWRDLFAEDGHYWVPARPEQTSWKTEVSLFLDDRKNIQARIDRLRHPRVHAQTPPSRTVHAITNIHLAPDQPDADAVLVRSALSMAEWRAGTHRTYHGRVQHTLVPDGDGFRIRLKRVDLVDAEDVHDAMAIPF